MAEGKRRLWKPEDKRLLMSLWDTVGSVTLISIMIKRSRSSVQTQASRSGLPQRDQESDRHRRRWADGDDVELDALMERLSADDGTIPIVDVSNQMGRSIDAIVARLEARHGEDSDVMARLVAPPIPALACPLPGRQGMHHAPGMAVADGHAFQSKRKGRNRECLDCREDFWSEGNHNRVCPKCKRISRFDYP